MSKYERENLARNPNKEAFRYLADVSKEAATRISERLAFEESNVKTPRLPLGGEEGLDEILSFIPTAKQGLTLSLRSGGFEKNQLRDIVSETTFDFHGNYSNYFEESADKLKSQILDANERVVTFRHSLITLLVLGNTERLNLSGPQPKLGEGVETISFWPKNPDTERVWELFEEIEQATWTTLMDYDVNASSQSIVRAAHFFETGSGLASQFV